MTNSNLPVTSREYKLMLNVDRFKNRKEGKEAFWDLVSFYVEKNKGSIKTQDDEEEIRRTYYIDTPTLLLKNAGYILRVREEEKGNDTEYKVTLKYRSSDRYLSAIQPIEPINDELKFEEDITPPFISKFSKSTSLETTTKPVLDKISDVVDIFSGLDDLKLPKDTPVEIVNSFQAHEVSHKFGSFKFGDKKIKAAFSFWYLLGKDSEIPIVAEFSFDYGAKDSEGDFQLEMFSTETVSGANKLFLSLQNQLGWLNLNSTTKTAFAIESM